MPEETDTGRWIYLKNKLQWMLFALIFPEVITGIGAEQWASAFQCVQDLAESGHTNWTMRHAFYANMGGFLLESPDFPAFPIDGQQIGYLVERKYLNFPDIDEKTIWDKNKADGFARAVTVVQIGWFCIQCIGRAIQHLPISTLELTTLTFIFCTLCTFFFWNHKPLDAETRIVLRTETPIAEVLVNAGDIASKPYTRTPLDFVKPARSRTSMLTLFWLGLEILLNFDMESKHRPIRAFGESKTTPPRGLRFSDLCFGLVFTFAYVGLHLVAWNFTFPTSTERILWRTASLSLAGLLVLYFISDFIGVVYPRQAAQFFYGQHAATIYDILAVSPPIMRYAPSAIVLTCYSLARWYILVEGFVGLRALPMGVYKSVNWSNFIPHI
ncbi:hypothetical protein H2200_001432 [Cladophialophora chaetospira]|uniref:Uncharacterized protein n=1 Tax=Cladophialophora chaetospira TaxID=386627 RepID=A0AA38XKV1_9EURO|nr:hypothetical protein H2200_001432 [Cladophialophora chaetospira]